MKNIKISLVESIGFLVDMCLPKSSGELRVFEVSISFDNKEGKTLNLNIAFFRPKEDVLVAYQTESSNDFTIVSNGREWKESLIFLNNLDYDQESFKIIKTKIVYIQKFEIKNESIFYFEAGVTILESQLETPHRQSS
jgi:hypothetical protein